MGNMESAAYSLEEKLCLCLAIIFKLLAVIGSFLSVFFLMLMMGISGTLGMAIPWMVGYFHIFWFKPAVNLELGIRTRKPNRILWLIGSNSLHIFLLCSIGALILRNRSRLDEMILWIVAPISVLVF